MIVPSERKRRSLGRSFVQTMSTLTKNCCPRDSSSTPINLLFPRYCEGGLGLTVGKAMALGALRWVMSMALGTRGDGQELRSVRMPSRLRKNLGSFKGGVPKYLRCRAMDYVKIPGKHPQEQRRERSTREPSTEEDGPAAQAVTTAKTV